MKNVEIRKAVHSSGITYWQLADAIGISPCTLSVWLRKELDGDRLARVIKALDSLCGGDVCNG